MVSNSPKTKQCIHFCNLCKMHNNPILKLDSTKIPIVEEHKFLGIIFDQKLTFKPHINYLRSKCNKTIQLLRVIAHTDWGADKKKLYQTLIQSKLDYGTFISGSARKSYLKQSNIIYHQTATGTRSLQNLSNKKLVHQGECTSTINQMKTKPYNITSNWPHVLQTLPTMSSTACNTKHFLKQKKKTPSNLLVSE